MLFFIEMIPKALLELAAKGSTASGNSIPKGLLELVNKYQAKPEQLQEIYQRAKANNSMQVQLWEKRVQQITNYIRIGREPTERMKQELEIHKTYFTKAHSIHKVNSSFIKTARYLKNTQQLILSMPVKGGMRKSYTFYNVPIWVWLFLTTLPAHAGKKWWDKGFGIKYSSNPKHWMR